MKKIHFLMIAFIILSMTACDREANDFDASGTFEAVEILISAEANGKILQFDIREGQELKKGQVVGYIDSTQLYLQKLQLEQSKRAVLSGRPQTKVQIKALKEQLATARKDRDRIANLVKGGVANQKQLDDANALIATLEAQIAALESSLNTTTSSIDQQAKVIDIQLKEVKDQLAKCRIVNPVKGTVLSKYAEPYEMTTIGRPLYKIADLKDIILRAYITGDQLPKVRLNQQVKVYRDNGEQGYKESTGVVSWISDKAEFTPKSIHTKKERESLVYAIKVRVPNDGSYKIGMYGEIRFD
jgi:HlyD family secretion protein